MASRDGFVFYRSFYKAISKLSQEDAYNVFMAICAYALDYQELELDTIPSLVFDMAKPQLEANYKRWLNGCKGGAPVGNKNNASGANQYQSSTKGQPKLNQSSTKGQAKEKEKEKEKEKVKEKEKDKDKEKELACDTVEEAHRKFLAWKGSLND